MDKLTQINDMITELRSNQAVEFIEQTHAAALPQDQQDSLLEELQNSRHADHQELFKDYIRFPMKINIAWEYKMRDEYQMGGRINLHNIAIVVLDEEFNARGEGVEQQVKQTEYKYFDKDMNDGEDFGATLIVPEQLKKLNTGILLDGKHYRTSLSYSEYLDQLVITKGFLYWQFLFCTDPLADDLRADFRQNYFSRMLEDLPDLFPDHDYRRLKELADEF